MDTLIIWLSVLATVFIAWLIPPRGFGFRRPGAMPPRPAARAEPEEPPLDWERPGILALQAGRGSQTEVLVLKDAQAALAVAAGPKERRAKRVPVVVTLTAAPPKTIGVSLDHGPVGSVQDPDGFMLAELVDVLKGAPSATCKGYVVGGYRYEAPPEDEDDRKHRLEDLAECKARLVELNQEIRDIDGADEAEVEPGERAMLIDERDEVISDIERLQNPRRFIEGDYGLKLSLARPLRRRR